MSITKVYIPDYELEYIESKPDRPAASYVSPECDSDYSEEVKYHEFVDISSVWHDASEEPEKGVDFLCDDYIEGFRVNIWTDAEMTWPDYCCISGMTKWAYVRDLLPKGGEK